MTQRMQDIAAEIVRLQGELDREIESRRKALGVRITARLVEFEEGVVTEHRLVRQKISHFLAESNGATIMTAPIICSLIIPLLLLDLWVSAYQAICFRVYAIDRVRRADYIVFDRQHLAYLNLIEAANCLFCAYGKGVVAYVRKVSSRTEQYWCPYQARAAHP